VNRLSAATVAEVRGDAPTYDRAQPPTIAHLGVGAFARAHVAVYADELLRAGEAAMLRGVSLRSRSAEEALAPQDGLYTVTTR
jgi:fructuronate reductase